MSPDRPAARSETPLLRLEHAVHSAVGEAVLATERTLAQQFGAGFLRGLRLTLKSIGIAAVLAYFVFGALLLTTRWVLMPRIDEARPWLEREASRLLATEVRIGQIRASWQGFNPRLLLTDVQLRQPGGHAPLRLPQLDATLSWLSVPTASLRFASLTLLAPELEVQRLPGNRFVVAGFALDPAAASGDTAAIDWLLRQQHLAVREARLRYVDAGVAGAPPQVVDLTEVNAVFAAGLFSNRWALQARPAAEVAGRLDLRASVRYPWFERPSDVRLWRGRLFVQSDFVDLARVEALARALPAGLALSRGQGALRAWLTFDELEPLAITADLALTDVSAQLGADLAPLRLESVQGRFSHRRWGNEYLGGHELQLTQFALQDARGDLLPPTDLRLRVTRAGDSGPARSEFEASLISLDQLTALADHVPLARDVRENIGRYAVRGSLAGLRLTWEGEPARPARYTLRTAFDGLSVAAAVADPLLDAQGKPRAGRPGMENLSGRIEATETGGALTLAARGLELDLPGILEPARVPLDQLTAQVRWSMTPGGSALPQLAELRVESLTLANDDVDLALSGSWRRSSEPAGSVDINGRINRWQVPATWRYLPARTGPQTRAWFRHALLGGELAGGTLRLRGELARFPFADPKSGEFRIDGRVRGATLDYQPVAVPREDGSARAPWPRIDGIDADLLLDRAALRVTGRSGTIYGNRLSDVRVRIPDLLSPDAHLLIEGQANGPAADQLRFVNESPVGALLNGFFASATVSGASRLDLKLDIPLTHARDTLLSGSVTLPGNDVTLTREIPPLTRASGRVEFSDKGFRLVNTSAGFVGGTARFDGGTRPDRATEITVAGTATPQGARRALDVALVQRLLDRAQGSTRYTATALVRERRTDLRIDSDLVGWSLDGPAPARKSAAEPMPLRIDSGPSVLDPGARGPLRDGLAVSIGNLLALRFERMRTAAEAEPRVVRGAIGVGADAQQVPLPDGGVLALVSLPALDVDRWSRLLDDGGAPARPGSGMPDFVGARVGELQIVGKTIANVVLGATRAADGSWNGNVASDHASGSLVWQPPQPGNPGRVSARLARLSIPDMHREELTGLFDAPPTEVPAFDVVAEQFELGSRKLGRLDLVAHNSGGTAGVWQLQKLEIVNPDGRLSASGQWRREPGGGARRMAITLALDFSNGGALLTRLGIPDALRGASGRLEGELGWRGSPLALDLPTLGGQLKLTSTRGQFLKADAGAGRLLGVLSLQSLPRRITLDFRDVFTEGFAFDTISASAEIDGGVLTTRDFRMRGVNANVLIEGTIDLRRETQNLHVLVLPEINAGSASLAYALLANPAIGLGTFLAQLVLRDPLAKAFSFEYDITGTWTDPSVKRRERVSTGAPPSNP
jgi:uncharacterized protein (TIGR02099 family)